MAAARITSSTAGSDGAVSPLPAALLEQARRKVPDLDLNTYTLARVVASEFGSGPYPAQLAIADADATRARTAGRSIHNHATGGGTTYGRQGYNGRPVSTSLDPTMDHVAVARAALASPGFARGATFYFDPRTQYSCWSQPLKCIPKGTSQPNRLQHPLAILESWSFKKTRKGCARDEKNRYYCTYGERTGRAAQWVGQINGINPYDLMLFKPKADDDHEEMTAQAKRIIEAGIRGQSGVHVSGSTSSNDVLLFGAALAGLAWWRSQSR